MPETVKKDEAEKIELEVIESTKPAIYAPAMEMDRAIKLFDQIRVFCKKNMIEGIDFGKIPNVDKPSLFKSGAEKLNIWFNLIPSYDVRTEMIKFGDKEILSIDTDCILKDISGNVRGTCSGNCNSAEDKYSQSTKWMSAAKLPPDLDKSKLKSKELDNKYPGGAKTYTLYAVTITPNPFGLLNTMKKMSQKRAFIGAILMATGTSQVFAESTSDNDEDSKTEKSGNGKDKKAALNLVSKLYSDKKIGEKARDGWTHTLEGAKPNALAAIIKDLEKLNKKLADGKTTDKKIKKTDFEYECGCIHTIDDKKKPYTECPDHPGKGIKSQGRHKDPE